MYALHFKMREIKWPEKQYYRVKALMIKIKKKTYIKEPEER